jgi:beta-lactamase class A
MMSRAAAEAEIARIAGFAQGDVGFAARHLSSGAALAHRGGEGFPMASTIKVPLALTILEMVDQGRLRLEQMVAVEAVEMNPSAPIGEEFFHPGVSLSLANLLEPMITRSDNTATDVLFRLAGGPAAVAAWLARLGIAGITPSRSVRDLLIVLYGIDPGPEVALRDALRALPPAELAAAKLRAQGRNPAYSNDPRDQATPEGMVELLARLFHAEGISEAARATLLPIMGRTSTGLHRIEGRLPPGVAVANKTGSASGTTNDVGIVALPGDRGAVAMAVYVKDSALPPAEREVVIANVARTAYDYFVFME